MAQFARPDNDDANVGAWVDEASGGTNIYQSIDETSPSDTDYVDSLSNPTDADLYECGLSAVTDPESSDPHTLRVRMGKHASGGRSTSVVVRLFDGGTEIGTDVITANDTQLDATATYTYELSAAEADAISAAGYAGALKIQFDPVVTGGGAGRSFRAYWAELEVPDAPAAAEVAAMQPMGVTWEWE
jgi:hypothetical protein